MTFGSESETAMSSMRPPMLAGPIARNLSASTGDEEPFWPAGMAMKTGPRRKTMGSSLRQFMAQILPAGDARAALRLLERPGDVVADVRQRLRRRPGVDDVAVERRARADALQRRGTDRPLGQRKDGRRQRRQLPGARDRRVDERVGLRDAVDEAVRERL